MEGKPLSELANSLISVFDEEVPETRDRKISVNPVVSKVASIYEKVRNAMDYRDQEVILRAAIERILKRRTLFGGVAKTIAEPLVRELVWARYFPDESVSESMTARVEERIDLYIKLRHEILAKHSIISEKSLNEWIYHLMSSDVEHTLCPRKKKEYMSNFMFRVMRDNITIIDEGEQQKDIQVFIAVHKSYAKDDLAMLRFHLFNQFLGKLTAENLPKVIENFPEGYREINNQLNYPRKDKIFNYIKDKTVIFFVLEDFLNIGKGGIKQLINDDGEFRRIIYSICEARYAGIASKVRTAIFRSIIFLLLTKALFALSIEGTFESIFYGRVLWTAILINIVVPPLLMAALGFSIKTPDRENSKKIFNYIRAILLSGDPKLANQLSIKTKPDKMKPLLNTIFSFLWIITFFLVFGIIFYVLNRFSFNPLSMFVFVFFLAIVSFLAYRINQVAKIYSIEPRKNVMTSVTDFLFIPFVTVGRKLTDGISQINVFLFLLDFVIEAPFKGLFSFFEQWFLFLQNKREELE
ncbi:MAG: hypothetical protein COY68_00190 [Candidatus Levybacteria bacterium CG_4_10_14_0_8_um_filter_35_23]|nr:MAG: hypothetical protein COY68_00190 [Candidatus Levybacteria bacterium CG_4_10_14_0_8_um_filter_35_23]